MLKWIIIAKHPKCVVRFPYCCLHKILHPPSTTLAVLKQDNWFCLQIITSFSYMTNIWNNFKHAQTRLCYVVGKIFYEKMICLLERKYFFVSKEILTGHTQVEKSQWINTKIGKKKKCRRKKHKWTFKSWTLAKVTHNKTKPMQKTKKKNGFVVWVFCFETLHIGVADCVLGTII